MRLMSKVVLLTAGLTLGFQGVSFATDYNIDPYHSSISFSVKHVIGKVIGHFDKFSGTFSYDDGKPLGWAAMATIDASSINTGIDKRDTHLRSPDFFDVQKYPSLDFKSTSISDVQGNKAKLHGNLTMHGVTKPVILDLDIAGAVKDPMDKTGKGMRAGATATGRVNRLDFGIGPASGPIAGMVGNDVDITIDIEGVSK